jgi:hypothetical protein
MLETRIRFIIAFIIINTKVFNSTSYNLVGIGLTEGVCNSETNKQVASLNYLTQ